MIMTEKDDKLPPDVSPPASSRPERRRSGVRGAPRKVDAREIGSVGHDELGNAVWTWRVDVPRRRDDDPTIDLIDCLDIDSLSLEDENAESPEEQSFNPYNKSR